MKQRSSLLRNDGMQTIISSLLCVILGLFFGFIVLLVINANGAWDAILAVIKNFFAKPPAKQFKYFGQTLVKTAPLLLCSLSVLFAYKVGLFNIGVAGQYVLGVAASLYCALGLQLPWYLCVAAAIAAGALSGAICGVLRSYCNVNVVISGIMLNWISLYATNLLLKPSMNPAGKDTFEIVKVNKSGILPSLGLDKLFGEDTVTIAIPIAIIVAIAIWIILDKTKFGYELKATGNNLHAAKYCGMKENRNIILTMAISGALAALGAALLYLTDFEQWNVNTSSVPGMGFNGIAAAFLGGLNPIGTILSSYFIQHITLGGGNVNLNFYCAQIADFISSMIIYLCGFVLFFKTFMNSTMDKREERKAARAKALTEADNAEGGSEQ